MGMKVLATFSLDADVVEAFNKWCPSGERSSTINELIRERIQADGFLKDDKSKLLQNEMLRLQEQAAKVESLKRTIETERSQRERAEALKKAHMEQQKENSDLNKTTKELARVLALEHVGLPPGTLMIPPEKHEKFMAFWKAKHKELIAEGLK